MSTITNLTDLVIWIEARDLYKKILEITKREGINKDFRFKSNIREAAGSVMDNIAEGFERNGNAEFINFLSISKGSIGKCVHN